VLDLGAGEGKNAIYLAEKGFRVTAVECSSFAIKNFIGRMATLEEDIRSRIEVIQANVIDYVPIGHYDAGIAYGLLHCLPNVKAIQEVLSYMKEHTSHNGYNVVVALTNQKKIPRVQNYLKPTLLPADYFRDVYKNWDILTFEDSTLVEMHPTSRTIHRHGICRILARKVDHEIV
jgi:tellurite methyltransferase